MKVEERLDDLGLELTDYPTEKGKVAPALRSGNLVFTSAVYSDTQGKLGQDITAAEGYQIAQEATVQCLSAIRSVIGDLDHISRIVKLHIAINCVDTFTDQVQVYHGATELLLDVFGEEIGRHTRSATGVYQLHDNAALSVEMIVEVR